MLWYLLVLRISWKLMPIKVWPHILDHCLDCPAYDWKIPAAHQSCEHKNQRLKRPLLFKLKSILSNAEHFLWCFDWRSSSDKTHCFQSTAQKELSVQQSCTRRTHFVFYTMMYCLIKASAPERMKTLIYPQCTIDNSIVLHFCNIQSLQSLVSAYMHGLHAWLTHGFVGPGS